MKKNNKKTVKKGKNNQRKKGFTLVELLAVIIILAIVVGITIPAVLTTTNKTKEKAFQTAADSVANWFDRQYEIYTTGVTVDGIATLDENFIHVCTKWTNPDNNKTYQGCISEDGMTTQKIIPSVVTAAGLKSNNIISGTSDQLLENAPKINDTLQSDNNRTRAENDIASYVMINKNTGRSCVKLVAEENGDYPARKIACGGICRTDKNDPDAQCVPN